MRIYLDMCCLKRPFDDQADARIQMETNALAAILLACKEGVHELVTSDALRFENSRNPNPDRQEFAARAMAQANHDIRHDAALEQRAILWQNHGVELLDALHLASAESAGADVFATTDDVILNRARRNAANLRVLSLLDLFREVAS